MMSCGRSDAFKIPRVTMFAPAWNRLTATWQRKDHQFGQKQDILHGIHLRFVHDSDEPAVDVDDDVSLANAALVRVGLLLHATKNKVKTKLVAEIIQMSFLSLSSLKSTFHINQLYTLTFTFTFLNFHFTLLLGVVHILRNCGQGGKLSPNDYSRNIISIDLTKNSGFFFS